jgi:predicted metal-dependent enzyme (double-stranded beta helix superfamily)
MDLEQFCNRFEDVLAREDKSGHVIHEGRALLAELMGNTQWFQEFLKKIILDASFRQQQKPSRWPNEYTVHRSPAANFVMLAYIWEPHQVDVIHDHNAWGLIGTLTGKVDERKYRRVDDGTKDGYAELEEITHKLVMPGETTFVMPLDGGIHRMDNLTDCSISINVYGKSVRKGYLHYYDFENRTVTRTYIYPLYRAALAVRALGHMEGAAPKEILDEAMSQPVDELLKREAALSLLRLEENRKAKISK